MPDPDELFQDLINLIDAGLGGPGDPIDYTEVNGVAISTVVTRDCGPETALIDANGVHPVERYSSIPLAIEGHQRWVNTASEDDLEITELGYGTVVESKKVTVKPYDQTPS